MGTVPAMGKKNIMDTGPFLSPGWLLRCQNTCFPGTLILLTSGAEASQYSKTKNKVKKNKKSNYYFSENDFKGDKYVRINFG